jgi:MFS family permease
MTATERRATLGLAGVYGFRMLGLFLILPVFALFAEEMPGATPLLTGLAVGIYGLTQALLQIPFGLLSDRIGRKPVILGGLLLFALGSALAATASDIWMVILGRAIQGSGAIAAAVMALAADLTREEQRTKAMATIGMTIGASFMIAMMAGPVLGSLIGVSGIFWLTAVLALVGLGLVGLVVPTPVRSSLHRDAETVPTMVGRVLRTPDLLRLDFGIFA